MADLTTEFCGVKMKNPLVLGAGPLSRGAALIRKCIDAGFGAVCTKTASQFEYYHKFPYTRYHLVGYEYGSRGRASHDWVWFHNDHNAPVGPEKFVEVIAEVSGYARDHNCLLIGTYAAATMEEWEKRGVAYCEAGAGMLELNFCCPGPSTLADVIKKSDSAAAHFGNILQNPEDAYNVVKKVRSAVDIPIVCKLPPSRRLEIKEIVAGLRDAGADGVEMYANNKGMRIDIESATPVGFGCGTVNSHGHLAETLYDVSQLVMANPGVAIMAGRGVRTWDEVVELLMTGASVAEVCTSIIVYGLGYGQEMLEEIGKYMDRKGYPDIASLRGQALKNTLKPSQIKDKVTPVFAQINGIQCKGCGRCYDVCAFRAVEVFHKAGRGVAKINRARCVGCTLCSQVCPKHAITLEPRSQEEYLAAQDLQQDA
ncbi:MAG: 4Fe-4S dicluster domain-containing protein [Firmicutes bacterium]|nr:4Fe-4S dicluster domain-containing protein [Bacillota bacterium]